MEPFAFDYDAFLERLHGLNRGLLRQHHIRSGLGESRGGWELNYARCIPVVVYNEGLVIGGSANSSSAASATASGKQAEVPETFYPFASGPGREVVEDGELSCDPNDAGNANIDSFLPQ